jgi:PKD repeat protein
VVDQGGASATKIRTLTVEAPTVDFSWKPEQPKTDEEVTFTAQPEPNEYGFGYRWDFGDGTIWPARDQPPAPTNQATHTYKLAPTDMEKKFTVTLTVTGPGWQNCGDKIQGDHGDPGREQAAHRYPDLPYTFAAETR